MPTPWVSREVRSLVDEVKKTGVRCVWVGPTWGDNETQDGAKNSFKKTYARTEQMSNFLSDNVAPCIYIDSQKMWGKGEVPTHDGQHMTNEGYVKWGSAIAEQILLQYKKGISLQNLCETYSSTNQNPRFIGGFVIIIFGPLQPPAQVQIFDK
ncbi:MAG: hypothetical protein WC774_01585 [Candidatus Gracilibacteria bacterium]